MSEEFVELNDKDILAICEKYNFSNIIYILSKISFNDFKKYLSEHMLIKTNESTIKVSYLEKFNIACNLLVTDYDNIYNINNLKEQKKRELQTNYQLSKDNCILKSIKLEYLITKEKNKRQFKGIDNTINLCSQWLMEKQTEKIPSLNIDKSIIQVIYDKLMLMRDNISNNVETEWKNIEKLDNINDVGNFVPTLEVVFKDSIVLDDLLDSNEIRKIRDF